MKNVLKVLAFAMSLVLFLSCSSKSADYPTKSIVLVVPYSPGGVSDTAARIYGQLLEKEIGVPVVVENRTGGAGSVGLSYVQKSRADGYVIGFMPVETVMLEALGYVELKPTDFAFLGGGMIVPSMLTVAASARWNTYEEFISYAKANPGQVRVGNSGPGSIWHFAAAALGQETGAEFTHIPFEGGATAVAALLGGHIEAVTVSESEVQSGVFNGDLKVLVSLGETPSDIFEDNQTLTDIGVDLVVVGWGGFAVAAGTPENVLKVLIEKSEKVLKSDDFKNQVSERGIQYGYKSAADMQKFADDQYDFFAPLIKSLNLNE